MAPSASTLLAKLLGAKANYSPETAELKRWLVELLGDAELRTAPQVRRFHDALCFLRAYPDDPELLREVERVLDGFAEREDLKRHAPALASTGIAGTTLHFALYWRTARWLVDRCGASVTIDWEEFEHQDRIPDLLELLLPHAITPLYESGLGPRELLATLKSPDETDAAFLVVCFVAAPMPEAIRQKLYDDLDVPLRIAPGPRSPTRTSAHASGSPRAFRTGAFVRPAKPVETLKRSRRAEVTRLSPRRGKALIDLARGAMLTRLRDLYAFWHANHRDVRLVDSGDGLQTAWIGIQPRHRIVLEAMYVGLMLQNGVPVGYVQASALLQSAAVNFNVFESFRAANASSIFVAALAAVKHLFGTKTFVINTQQLGEDNPEAIATGAWWFYLKHGFRPRDPDVREVMNEELARKKRDPRHRSSPRTLRRLARGSLYLALDGSERTTVTDLDAGAIGQHVSRVLIERFGTNREEGVDEAVRETRRLLGLRRDFLTPAEEFAWAAWSPLVLCVPEMEAWSRGERADLRRLILSKGADDDEIEFVTRFDAHRKLRRAILDLASSETAARTQS